MRMKKRILCQGEAKTSKNGRKRTKNGYCVNSPLWFAQLEHVTLFPGAIGCKRFKNTRFLLIRARLCVWPRNLCSGIPFHSSNWQTDVFYFEDR